MTCIVYSVVPRLRAPPGEKGGVWRRDYIMYESTNTLNMYDQRTRQYANMYDNEHTVCVCICMTTNTLPVRYVAVKYL